MHMLKVPSALVIALFVAASSEPANAVDVEYTLTFAETGRDRANGTGTLIVNEPTPINSFSENSYGDLVSLTANIGGRALYFCSVLRGCRSRGRIKRSTASRVHLHLVWWDRMVCLEPWCLADSAFGLSMPADLILTWGASPWVRVSFKGCPPRKAYECLLAGKSTSPEIHDGHRELSCEGILSAHQSHEEKMKISIVVFSCLLTQWWLKPRP